MKKFTTLAFALSLLILPQGCGSRAASSLGTPTYSPQSSDSTAPPAQLPPQERQAIENKERFSRLREHQRLSQALADAYKQQALYANGGSCAALRSAGITGLCEEVASPMADVSPEIQAYAVDSGDESFARRISQEAARWRDSARSDKEEIDQLCQTPKGRCDTGDGFKYWQEDGGETTNEDVEMLNLASNVTEQRLVAYILGSVSSGDLFVPAANGGDPKKGYEALQRIRELPSLPVAPKGYYEGDSMSLSGQAIARKRILESAGLGNLEAIQ